MPSIGLEKPPTCGDSEWEETLGNGGKRIYAQPGNSGGPVKGGVEQSGGHSSPTLSGSADLSTLGPSRTGPLGDCRIRFTDNVKMAVWVSNSSMAGSRTQARWSASVRMSFALRVQHSVSIHAFLRAVGHAGFEGASFTDRHRRGRTRAPRVHRRRGPRAALSGLEPVRHRAGVHRQPAAGAARRRSRVRPSGSHLERKSG